MKEIVEIIGNLSLVIPQKFMLMKKETVLLLP